MVISLMLDYKTTKGLIQVLKKDLKRVTKMRVPGFPRAYYCSFLLRDTHWFNTFSGSGSVYRRRSDRTRNVLCDLRVGSYRFDQVSDGGLRDNDEELESVNHVSVPIDDKAYDGLRLSLWRLLDAKFREAIADYNNRKTAQVSKLDPNRKLRSFVPLPSIRHLEEPKFDRIDEDYWVDYCKKASNWLNNLQGLTSGYVEFDCEQLTKLFVSTENRIISQHCKVFSLSATLRKLTKQGSHLEQEVVIHTSNLRELPDLATFKRMIRTKHQQLLESAKSKKIHSFSGPVLLYPEPAGLFIHEAVGHRLEGSRLLSSTEGQTFKDQIGKKVLNVGLTIRDNPKLKRFQGQSCIGAYHFDDEGAEGKDSLLIKDGVLQGFLNTRAEIECKGFKPNGHARSKKFQRPISRMAVSIIEATQPNTLKELKRKLIEEIQRQNRPFGMIVYDTCGGETETSAYDFQAFSGEIAHATLVYPNGREVAVRGVNFVGTPLQALANVIAVGDQQVLNNGFCGAESGFIPISTISPAILLSNMELQSKSEELVTQFILPKPRLKKRKRRAKK